MSIQVVTRKSNLAPLNYSQYKKKTEDLMFTVRVCQVLEQTRYPPSVDRTTNYHLESSRVVKKKKFACQVVLTSVNLVDGRQLSMFSRFTQILTLQYKRYIAQRDTKRRCRTSTSGVRRGGQKRVKSVSERTKNLSTYFILTGCIISFQYLQRVLNVFAVHVFNFKLIEILRQLEYQKFDCYTFWYAIRYSHSCIWQKRTRTLQLKMYSHVKALYVDEINKMEMKIMNK